MGPNVISCKLVTGSGKKKGNETWWFVVCCYSPPSDTEGNAWRLLEHDLNTAPKGTKTMVIGDLNANLADPRNGQEEVLSAGMREYGLECATRHFVTRRRRYVRGRWTYKKRCENGKGEARFTYSKPDYFLARREDRRRFRQ